MVVVVDRLVKERSGAVVGTVRRRGRRLDTYAVAIGGGLHANVVDGVLVGFGLEPIGPVIMRPAHERRLPVIAWAGPIAGAAAAGAAVATGFVLRHRRVA